jgi:hypothetical protein
MSFLERARYQTADGRLGFSAVDALLIKIACLLFARLPADDLSTFELTVPFVGRTRQFVNTESVTLRITSGGWCSTGLWLPPGIQCQARLSREIRELSFQVGSHSRDFFHCSPPWRRWPSLVVTASATHCETQIATPYGGLIYVLVDPESIADNGRPFAIEFSEVCIAPFYDCRRPQQWDLTREAECPWAEIQTKHVTFTMQSSVALAIPSIPESVGRLTELFDSIFAFLEVPDGAVPPRLVCDTGVAPPGIELGYPIFIDQSWAKVALLTATPDFPLLQFLASVAASLVPDGLFSPSLCGILCLLAASNAITKRWPMMTSIGSAELEGTILWPRLASLLGKIGSEPFTTSIARVRARAAAGTLSSDAVADIFVSTLSQRAKRTIPWLMELITVQQQSTMSLLEIIHGTG